MADDEDTASAGAADAGTSRASSSPRLRHVVSLHVRNFAPPPPAAIPTNADSSLPPPSSSPPRACLRRIALGISATPTAPPAYLTPPSDPAVHADWTIDPRHVASSSRSAAGQKQWVVSAWSQVSDDRDDRGWEHAWQVVVDPASLQPVTGGLTSPHLRRLPKNSVLVGVQQFSARASLSEGDTSAAPSSASAPLRKSISRAHVPTRTHVKYYLVQQGRPQPPHPQRRRRASHKAARSTTSEHSGDESGGDSDRGDDHSSDDAGAAGYDSETTYELAQSHGSHSAGSNPRTHTRRPSLNRRPSSTRTIRALQRDRRRRSSSRSQSSAAAALDRDRERQRENEILERSRWETRMMASYSWATLQEIISTQLDLCNDALRFKDDKKRLNARLNGRLNACHGVAGVAGVARRNASSALQGHVSHLASVSETQDADLRALRARIAAKREDLTRRRARLDYVRRRDDTHDDDDNDDDGNRAPRLRQSISHLAPRIHNRRAHLLDTLAFIYPIALVSAQDLLFSICGRALPNSPAAAIAEHAADEEDVAAALGYTAQLVALLSAYLETSLHYEIATAGSRSVIRDGISMMNGPRGFPLYSKGAEMYRFEYAVFLLTKNIEQLMNTHDLPVLDLRHILPNLNSLILTLSSRVGDASDGLGSNDSAATSASTSASTSTSTPRKGYRMVGKGEIVLPTKAAVREGEAERKDAVDDTASKGKSASNAVGDDNNNTSNNAAATTTTTTTAATTTATTTTATPPSAALSWTASLFGRSSRSIYAKREQQQQQQQQQGETAGGGGVGG